jgi:hypothetical protein
MFLPNDYYMLIERIYGKLPNLKQHKQYRKGLIGAISN